MATSPRSSSRSFRIAPLAFYGDLEGNLQKAIPDPVARSSLRDILWQLIEWQRLSTEVLNLAMQGKLNNGGTVTLATSSATTTITDPRIGADTEVILVPTTANAAAEVGGGTLYQTYPNVTENQAVLNHVNSATADRTYAFALNG